MPSANELGLSLLGAVGTVTGSKFLLRHPVARGQPLYTIHAETRGELNDAREFAETNGIFELS